MDSAGGGGGGGKAEPGPVTVTINYHLPFLFVSFLLSLLFFQGGPIPRDLRTAHIGGGGFLLLWLARRGSGRFLLSSVVYIHLWGGGRKTRIKQTNKHTKLRQTFDKL
jgi:hypothetical protein